MSKKVLGVIALVVIAGVMLVKILSDGSDAAPLIVNSGDSNNPTVDHFLDIDGILKLATGSYFSDQTGKKLASTNVATGTSKLVYTNSSGKDMMCDPDGGFLDVDTSGSFSPSLTFSMGTSTSATDATWKTNLMSSTTVATTTDAVLANTYTAPFKLASTESIVVNIQDGTTGVASSTYFSRWTIKFGTACEIMKE